MRSLGAAAPLPRAPHTSLEPSPPPPIQESGGRDPANASPLASDTHAADPDQTIEHRSPAPAPGSGSLREVARCAGAPPRAGSSTLPRLPRNNAGGGVP